MLIVCSSCVSSYRVGADLLAQEAGSISCAHCQAPYRAETTIPNASSSFRPLTVGNPLALGTRSLARKPVAETEARERSAARPLLVSLCLIGCGMAAVAGYPHWSAFVPEGATLRQALRLGPPDQGLAIEDVRTSLSPEGADRVLTVEGRIVNDEATEKAIPALRVVVRDQAAERVYSWIAKAPKPNLQPGEAVSFQSRLVSPPEAGHDLVVSFAEPGIGGGEGVTRDKP